MKKNTQFRIVDQQFPCLPTPAGVVRTEIVVDKSYLHLAYRLHQPLGKRSELAQVVLGT